MIGALVGKLFDAALLAIERSAKPLTVRSRPVLSNASLNVRPPLSAGYEYGCVKSPVCAPPGLVRMRNVSPPTG